jgi:FtsH-binding integral membrane protein
MKLRERLVERVRDRWTSTGTVLALACPGSLFAIDGPVGAAIGVLALLAWVVAPVYGFAVGQLGLVVVVPEPALGPRLAAAEGAVAVLLVAGLIRRRSPWSVPAFFVAALGLTGAVVAGIVFGVETWHLAAVLLGVTALASYLLHRYELVALGLVNDTGEGTSGPEATDGSGG